jgi:hypothetical protein
MHVKVNRVILFGFCLMGVLIVLACNISMNLPQQGTILLRDDFSGKSSYWKTWFESERSAVSQLNGELVMILEQPDMDIFSTNHLTYPNLELEVTAHKKHGQDDNIFGLVCRYTDENNYYSFIISSDGYFGVVKMLEGNLTLLSADTMQFTEEILRGSAANLLYAVCAGDDLEFAVNGEKLVSVRDPDLSNGRNGVMIGSFADSGDLVVVFDDFLARAR